MSALLAIWIIGSGIATVIALTFVLMMHLEDEPDGRRRAARFALTGWAWPLYALIGVRWLWRWAIDKEHGDEIGKGGG